MQRRDWTLWRLHVIKRTYTDSPQFGLLKWGSALDVWIGQTLWTFRRTHG